jgi:sugar/nucleoside kinase (ribokinase family)
VETPRRDGSGSSSFVVCVGLATLDTIAAVPRDPAAEDRVVAPAHAHAGAIAEVVSTIGAGDVVHGALVAHLFREEPPEEALAAANLAAALSCRALDGRSAIPTAKELRECLTTSR